MAYVGQTWLLALGLTAAVLKEKIPVAGPIWKLAVLVALAVLFDLAISGIALSIVMLVGASVWSWKIVAMRTPSSSRAFPPMVKVAGCVAAACALVFGAESMMVERSASEAVLRYGTPAPFVIVFGKEAKREEARKLIGKATVPHHVNVAAMVLSDAAEPMIDVPLLIGAMERFWPELDISHEMKKITGLELPRSTSPEVWRREWEKKVSGVLKDEPAR